MKNRKENYIYGIALIIIGCLLMIFNSKIVSVLIAVCGILFAGIGILEIINGMFTYAGIVKIVIGVVLIVFGSFLLNVCLVIFGALLCSYAIIYIAKTFKLLKGHKFIEKLKRIILPICAFIVGILLIVSGWKVVEVVFIIIGALVTCLGIYMLLSKEDVTHIEPRDDDIHIE